jgi:hypothetical protein
VLAAFNGTWDWTAIGTLALAAGTLAAVIVAAIALRQTRAAIALSRKEVEEAHRPVVVPVVGEREVGTVSRHKLMLGPKVRDGLVVIPIQNIGVGPALHVEASLKLLDADGKPSIAPTGSQTPGTVTGIGKDQSTTIEIRAHGWTEGASFELTIKYRDVAGKEWEMVGRYLADRVRYENVTIMARGPVPRDRNLAETEDSLSPPALG